MSIFSSTSRYLKFAATAFATDRRGRTVACVAPAKVPPQVELGKHRRHQEQRLDHLAQHYLDDPTAYWRIAELNGAMTADQIAEAEFLAIPAKGS
ncbi:MAG TPA: hypothetical protein VF688_02030 [Allosphingosinicella sp.]|jgi:hypothetical protein